MGGKWPEQHWERNEIVDGGDCPTLRLEYRPSSRHLHQSPELMKREDLMAEIQIPGFETLQKLSKWAFAEAEIFPQVWNNPSGYYRKITASDDDVLPSAISFFVFVILLRFALQIPVHIVAFRLNPLDLSTALADTILNVLEVITFSICIYVSSRLLRGKATLRETFSSMLFASVFTLLGTISDYVSFLDPGYGRSI